MAFSSVPTVATSDSWTASQHNTYIKDNFSAVWVGTTAGDIDYYSSATAKTRIAKGSAYQALRMKSDATVPEWGGAVAGKVIRTTNQSITTSTTTNVIFSSLYISRGSVSYSAGDPTKLTIGVTGLYSVGVYYIFEAGGGYREANILQNGSLVFSSRTPALSAASVVDTAGSPPIEITAGDYLQMSVWQNHGSSLNLSVAHMYAFLIGA